MSSSSHHTTRRGFIAAAGLGGVSLYGLWAAYGAAPGPLALFSTTDAHPASGGKGGHGGHGAAGGGPALDEFRRLTAEFVERYRVEDGSVYPRALSEATSAPEHGTVGRGQGGHDAHAHAPPGAVGAANHNGSPVDPPTVYLLAEKWFYEPAHLRLQTGQSYHFRMMASDVAHGASIQFGRSGRMIRLRPGTVTEMNATFTRPGRYLVYCTVYCGEAHDIMQGQLEVV